MSNEKEKESNAFREWFSSQRRFTSLSAMERALNITKDYLHLIKDGKRRAVDPELRRKLYEVTGLEIFKSTTETIKETPLAHESINVEAMKKTPTGVERHKESGLPVNLPTLLNIALKKLKLSGLECSKKYDISPNMLKKYRRGVARPSSDRNVAAVVKILEDAGLSGLGQLPAAKEPVNASHERVDFRKLANEIKDVRRKVDTIDARLSAAKLYEMPKSEPEFMNAETRAKRIMQILLVLSGELEFFKRCPESGREAFRKIIPGPDVGYVTTLLRALYDEDKFQRWLLFSNYEMRGNSGG